MVDQAAIGASSAALDVVSQCPSYAAALGYIGVAAAVCLSNWGAAVRYLMQCALPPVSYLDVFTTLFAVANCTTCCLTYF